MNALKIEMGAILALKTFIFRQHFMHDYINDNDKEPSWDGFIYLYKTDDLKVEDIKYKVPVQVKGKNQEDILSRQFITYPVAYKHLRNYYYDGGVFYIVVVISDDGEKSSIFYNSLTTIKLAELLKGTDKKGPNQTKNITLQKLEKSGDKLYRVLAQFGMERDKQGNGNGEIIKRAININTLNQVNSVQATSYSAKTVVDVLKEIVTGEISLYGHCMDMDMWIPFDYSEQQSMQFKQIKKINKSIGIDDINYYDFYYVEERIDGSDKLLIRISENLTLHLEEKKFNLKFNLIGNLTTLLRDINFIRAIERGGSLYIGSKKASELNNINISNALINEIEMIYDLNSALKEINFICNKNFSDFNDEDWKHIDELLSIYRRKIRLKENYKNTWYIWNWDGKIVPILLYNDDGKINAINWVETEQYSLFTDKGQSYAIPNFFIFKRDVLEKLYYFDEAIWIDQFNRIKDIGNIVEEIYSSFIELVAAYDVTKNEAYYNIAKLMIDKVLELFPTDEYGIINIIQLLKRKRQLTENEFTILEEIEQKSNDIKSKWAINVLLENRRKAQRLIMIMTDEEQEQIKTFPICNLLVI